MPLIPGQGAGLAAGVFLTVFYVAAYYIFKVWNPFGRMAKALSKPIAGDKKRED